MMNPIKSHWVMDVIIGQAKNTLRIGGQEIPHEPLTLQQWNSAREDVKSHAARLLAACQKDKHLTHADYLEYFEGNKGKQRG